MRIPLSPVPLVLLALLSSCGSEATPPPGPPPPAAAPDSPALKAARERMVTEQVVRLGVSDEQVIDAFRTVPRHAFLPAKMAEEAYEDRAVRRPDGEILTAPDLSAAMVELLRLDPDSTVLECGTRSGWLTAILARVAGKVITIDARPDATARARAVHERLGIRNVTYRTGDPLAGAPDDGPFDAVVVNGAVDRMPVGLYRSLVPGGRLLAPVGRPDETQTLILTIRGAEEPEETRAVLSVRFGVLPQKP